MVTENNPEQNVFVHLKNGRKYYAVRIKKYGQQGFMVTEHEVNAPFAVFVQDTEFEQLYISLEKWTHKLLRKASRKPSGVERVSKKPKKNRFKEKSYKENCAEYVCKMYEDVQKYGCYQPPIPRSREWEKHEWDSGKYARRPRSGT